MLSMSEDDGMADQSLQAEDAPTSDRTSDRGRNAGVAAQRRRRRWTMEQKRQIVAESLAPGVSVARLAHRHGISSGQFYAWRQQLLLAGALGAAADIPTSSASIEVPTTGPGGPVACATSLASPVLGTPVACLPAQADDPTGVVRPKAVAAAANEGSGAAVAAGEQSVLAGDCHGPDAAFHHVGVCALVKVHCSPRRKSGPANSRSSRKHSGRIRRRRMV